MAQVTLDNISYTKINTNPTEYLAQNHSHDVVRIIVTDTDVQPADADTPDFLLERHDAISDKVAVGYVWGKMTDRAIGYMGLKEG